MGKDDSKAAYFRRRSEAEQAAAQSAAHDRARAAHRELAALYAKRAEALATETGVPA